MSDDTIQIGKNFYTPSQIKAINELFGEGFLEANPHFPDEGEYKHPGHKYYSSRPLLLQERERRQAKEADKQRQYDLEQDTKRYTILEACAELSGTMHRSEEQIIARVIGESKNDCREKFTRQHLNYTGDNWQSEYKEWLSHWHYERFIADVIK